MRCVSEKSNSRILLPLLFCYVTASLVQGFPGEDYRYIERDLASPGAHQLASWLASQLRPKEIIPVEVPVIPYRLPLQGKRNSEVTNAIIGSEESQKMYREGR
ncbi:uncharacterized protein [Diabrotica undecimpunctata]|uniref:uncharacterized protein n=1 Tax=Diabrotica undecimpunctata TaxID=50387 RepID=UPI003B63B566